MKYNTQQLLFGETEQVTKFQKEPFSLLAEFYEKGYTVLSDIPSPEGAHHTTELFLAHLDSNKLPLFHRLKNRIQLAKADAIPVCADSVETSFQGLHFDMGQPIVAKTPQLMITVIGLYFPMKNTPGSARTRVLPLRGLFADERWGGAAVIEQRLLRYTKEHGDGWEDVNTYRLTCFARVVDAVSETNSLLDYRDKTMAEWFRDEEKPNGLNSMKREQQFYEERGIDLSKLEKHVILEPGQLLIIDNTRVTHGRIGKRQPREIYQFMFGVEKATPGDVDVFRKELMKELARSKNLSLRAPQFGAKQSLRLSSF